MTEHERRVILEVIDNLQEIDDAREDPYMVDSLRSLMNLLQVGPDFQEDGE